MLSSSIGSNLARLATWPPMDREPSVVPWYDCARAMNRVRLGSGVSFSRKYCLASFMAASIASDPMGILVDDHDVRGTTNTIGVCHLPEFTMYARLIWPSVESTSSLQSLSHTSVV